MNFLHRWLKSERFILNGFVFLGVFVTLSTTFLKTLLAIKAFDATVYESFLWASLSSLCKVLLISDVSGFYRTSEILKARWQTIMMAKSRLISICISLSFNGVEKLRMCSYTSVSSFMCCRLHIPLPALVRIDWLPR